MARGRGWLARTAANVVLLLLMYAICAWPALVTVVLGCIVITVMGRW